MNFNPTTTRGSKMAKKTKDTAYDSLMDILYDIGSDKDLKKAVESIKSIARNDDKKSDKIIKHLISIAMIGLDKLDEDIEKEDAAKAAK
jgi:hypothetical protein